MATLKSRNEALAWQAEHDQRAPEVGAQAEAHPLDGWDIGSEVRANDPSRSLPFQC